jgi:hypothetical protein
LSCNQVNAYYFYHPAVGRYVIDGSSNVSANAIYIPSYGGFGGNVITSWGAVQCSSINISASGTAITINGNACTGPGNTVWVSSVQTSQYVFAGQFGINGYELGWPGAAGNTGTFRTGDNRTVYVMGGIIYNVV